MSTPGNKKVRWGVAALAAALLLTAGAFIACQTIPLGEGPLLVGADQGRTESGGAWDIGTVISFGAPKVRNPTDNPIIVTKVTLAPESKDVGATVTAVYVVDMTGTSGTTGLGLGFPPANQAEHTFVPAAGATLKANTWYQILFVMRIDKPGEWAFPSFDITYKAGRIPYKATVHEGLRLCAPKKAACGGWSAATTSSSSPM